MFITRFILLERRTNILYWVSDYNRNLVHFLTEKSIFNSCIYEKYKNINSIIVTYRLYST